MREKTLSIPNLFKTAVWSDRVDNYNSYTEDTRKEKTYEDSTRIIMHKRSNNNRQRSFKQILPFIMHLGDMIVAHIKCTWIAGWIHLGGWRINLLDVE